MLILADPTNELRHLTAGRILPDPRCRWHSYSKAARRTGRCVWRIPGRDHGLVFPSTRPDAPADVALQRGGQLVGAYSLGGRRHRSR